jgi:hypothetical protein
MRSDLIPPGAIPRIFEALKLDLNIFSSNNHGKIPPGS